MKHVYCCIDCIRHLLILISLGLVFLPLPVYAQGGGDLKFERITPDDGLSGTHIPSIVQDSRGFMWFATENGLNRYDGYETVVYKHEADDTHSLNDNGVNALYVDSEGVLWVGTVKGLHRFDYTTETFLPYRQTPGDLGDLIHRRIRHIMEDSTGALWVATLEGLYRFERKTGTLAHYEHDPHNGRSLSHNYVWHVYEDRQNTIWVGTTAGLNRFHRDSDDFTRYQYAAEAPQSLSQNKVLSIHSDSTGALWVGTEGGGLNRFDLTTKTFTHYVHRADDPYSLSNNTVNFIHEDRSGTLWIGTLSGLSRFNRENETFTRYTVDSNNPYSLSGLSLMCIFEDRAGTLWIGTMAAGISKLDQYTQQFDHYWHHSGEPQSLGGNKVSGIHEDHRGQMWVGFIGEGLDRLNPTTGEFTHFVPDTEDKHTLNAESVRAIAEDSAGRLWLGTWGGGLERYDPTRGEFVSFRYDPNDPQSIGSNLLEKLIVDDAQQLWIGTWGGGLNHFDPETGIFTRYRHSPDDPSSLADDRVHNVLKDSTGTLWVGVIGRGVDRFDPATNTFMHYPPDDTDPYSIVGGSVIDIYEDSRGIVWLGTTTGLSRYDRDTDRFYNYTTENGLNDDAIRCILEDDTADHNLWISTSKGLTRFNPQTETFRHYDATDGLQNGSFAFISCAKSRTGKLYFGGENGLNRFDPAMLKDNPYVPPVVLTDFRLFHESVPIEADAVLPAHINELNRLTLAHNQNLLSFEFAALNYTAPQKNQYAYRLEGVDPDWVYVGSDRRYANYTSLRPGTYTFRVKASNNDGVWNEKGKTLTVTILPPWWATWWFRGLAVVGIIVVGLSAYRWRLGTLEHRQRVLTQQVQERTADLETQKEILRESEERFAAVMNSIEALIYVADMTTYELLFINQYTRDRFGDVVGQICWQALQIGQTGPCEFCTNVHLLDEEGQPTGVYTWEFQNTTTGHWYYIQDQAIRWTDGRLVRLEVATDITAQKQAEQELLVQRERLVAFEERERIGHELHDDLGQTMGYLNLQVQTALALLDEQRTPQVETLLKQLVPIVQDTQSEVREYILGIRQPDARPSDDFLTALQKYADVLHQRYGIETQYHIPEGLPRHPFAPEVEIQLLRILQEALTNVAKHAEVDNVHLTLTLDEAWAKAVVEDKGVGFACPSDLIPEAWGQVQCTESMGNALTREKGTGVGLGIMQKRAGSVGGTLTIQSTPGMGTRLQVRVPRTLPAFAGHEDLESLGLRVLLVDDHPLFLTGLHQMLSARGIQVVGMAYDGQQALTMARQLRPNVILMDVQMPHCDGVEATGQILAELPDIKIVMLTVAADDDTLFAALKNGASGYLLKSLDSDTLFRLLSDLMRGEVVIAPGLASRVLAEFARGQSQRTRSSPPEDEVEAEETGPVLTPRQVEVLRLVSQGLTYKQVADQLYISENTVKYHMGQIVARLHVKNRAEAIAYAVQELDVHREA